MKKKHNLFDPSDPNNGLTQALNFEPNIGARWYKRLLRRSVVDLNPFLIKLVEPRNFALFVIEIRQLLSGRDKAGQSWLNPDIIDHP